jgi:PrtD family type I secretion system ABC transporter
MRDAVSLQVPDTMTSAEKPRSEIWSVLLQSRPLFLAAFLFGFFINVALLAVPIYMLQVFDRVISSQSMATLAALTLITVIVLMLYALLDSVRGHLMVKASNRMDEALRGRVFRAMFERSLRTSQGGHVQPLQDLESLRQFVSGNGLVALLDLPWAPLFVVVIYLLHPLLGHFAVGSIVILVFLALLNDRLLRKPLSEANAAQIKSTQFAESSLDNAEALKAMGMMGAIRARWDRHHEAAKQVQTSSGNRASSVTAATKFVRLCMQMGIMAMSATLVLDQHITPGAMIAASILLSRALAPAEQAVGAWRQLLLTRLAFHRLDELLRNVPEVEKGMSLPRPKGELALEQVIAGPPGTPAATLRGVALRLEAGETLAVIGPSGAGKSTLARVVVGIWNPMAGKVRLDGADIRTWDHDELGQHLGYLPQDVELFEGTVAENIARFGEFTHDEVIQAATRAGMHEDILRLPQGYNAQVGEGGRLLSGGMRQRVGLARALYGNPALVVLDEPNANLDNAGEEALLRALRQLKEEGVTIVLVAHRPSILASADKILVLNNGAVERFGPASQVLPQYKPQQAAKALQS